MLFTYCLASFCPALTVISDTLKLSHNVAGVTFLALGNGAPDIFSVYSSINNVDNGARLALGELFGTSSLVTTCHSLPRRRSLPVRVIT